MRRKNVIALAALALAVLTPGNALWADEPAQGKAGAFERRFLEKMPHHHRGAVEMANVCQQKASHAELKPFCQNIASDQSQEQKQMEGWLQSWYQGQGAMPRAEMDKMMAQHKQDMAKLNAASGEQFDREFLMSMTKHHQQGQPEMKRCTTRAGHQELKQLCTKMAGEQQKENGQMQQWQRAWFGAAGKAASGSHSH